MRLVFAMAAFGVLAACGDGPHAYPAEAQAQFHASCPTDNPVCACTWEKLTETIPYEEYEAAMATFAERGTMDPRITRASVSCRERHTG